MLSVIDITHGPVIRMSSSVNLLISISIPIDCNSADCDISKQAPEKKRPHDAHVTMNIITCVMGSLMKVKRRSTIALLRSDDTINVYKRACWNAVDRV